MSSPGESWAAVCALATPSLARAISREGPYVLRSNSIVIIIIILIYYYL